MVDEAKAGHEPTTHAMPMGAPAWSPPAAPFPASHGTAHDGHAPPPATGGPILLSYPGAASNMVISGPAIVQAPPPMMPRLLGPADPCPYCGRKAEAGDGGGSGSGPGAGQAGGSGTGLPLNWNVPEGVGRELARLVKLADEGDAPQVTVGGAQAMLLTLLAEMPEEVRKPKPKPSPWWRAWYEITPAKPDKTPLGMLERACEHGWITRSMLEAARKLPLEPSQTKGGSSKSKPFVRFLVELADVIYAQPSRMA